MERLVESSFLGQLCNGFKASKGHIICLGLGAMEGQKGGIFFFLYDESMREKEGFKGGIISAIYGCH